MENNPIDERLKRVEKKLRLLFVLAIVQTLVIALLVVCLFVGQFMPSTLTSIVLLAALATFLYVFRSQIPVWFGNASRLFFSQVFEVHKSDSMKEDVK